MRLVVPADAMNAFQRAEAIGLDLDTLALDQRTVSLLRRRGLDDDVRPAGPVARHRGWLVRRALLIADIAGLMLAFAGSKLVTSGSATGSGAKQLTVLLLMLPLWVVAAKLCGLYERDEEHVDHSTVDEIVGVFHLATLGVWVYFVLAWGVGADAHVPRLIAFWMLATIMVIGGRGLARGVARRSPLYLQNTLILGAGHIGQLAARKLLQHPEYRINLVGFVDHDPRPRRPELEHLALLGPPDRLAELITLLDVERVIIAFSDATHDQLLETIRELRKLDLHIDVVPRLFEIVGPKADIHTFEGLPLVGLPPARLSPSSRLMKRMLDYVVSVAMLIVFAPLMIAIAIAIRLDSPGPILFRQVRLGRDLTPFTVLKFRSMRVDTDQEEHRRYISSTLTHAASPTANGMYKLDQTSSVTRVGRFLRKTSLDELPQLLNVLAGEMSLVGPRPCLQYETEGFADYHFERFLVPPGLTGLWQVTARAKSTFGEALDMDVEYVRGWSLSLDLHLLLKTPFSLIRMRATT